MKMVFRKGAIGTDRHFLLESMIHGRALGSLLSRVGHGRRCFEKWGEDLELTGSFLPLGPDQQPLLLV